MQTVQLRQELHAPSVGDFGTRLTQGLIMSQGARCGAGSKGLRHHDTSSWFVGLSNDTSSPRLAGMWPATKGKVFGAFGKRATTRKRALAGEGETVVLVSPQAL